MSYKSDTEKGFETTCAAPQYALDRISAGFLSSDPKKNIDVSTDFRNIKNPILWEKAFPSDIDWSGGWRIFWNHVRDEYGTGSEFSHDRIGIEIQTFFKNSTQWSRGVAIPNNGINENVAQYINDQILNAW